MIVALIIVTALFAWSELLSLLPEFKANGVFQAVFNFLRSMKSYLMKKLFPNHQHVTPDEESP